MTQPIDKARVWQRPLFTGAVLVGVGVCLWKLTPEHALDALKAFLWAGLFLYAFRGVIDKGALERIVKAWRGAS